LRIWIWCCFGVEKGASDLLIGSGGGTSLPSRGVLTIHRYRRASAAQTQPHATTPPPHTHLVQAVLDAVAAQHLAQVFGKGDDLLRAAVRQRVVLVRQLRLDRAELVDLQEDDVLLLVLKGGWWVGEAKQRWYLLRGGEQSACSAQRAAPLRAFMLRVPCENVARPSS
jgi:hypothetical protein